MYMAGVLGLEISGPTHLQPKSHSFGLLSIVHMALFKDTVVNHSTHTPDRSVTCLILHVQTSVHQNIYSRGHLPIPVTQLYKEPVECLVYTTQF